MDNFINELRDEIRLRDKIATDLLDRGHKAYLLSRNVGTFGFLFSTMLIFTNYRWLPIMFLLLFVTSMWITDYLNFAGQVLTELEFLTILKVTLEEVEMVAKLSSVEDETKFIADKMERLSVLRPIGK